MIRWLKRKTLSTEAGLHRTGQTAAEERAGTLARPGSESSGCWRCGESFTDPQVRGREGGREGREGGGGGEGGRSKSTMKSKRSTLRHRDTVLHILHTLAAYARC